MLIKVVTIIAIVPFTTRGKNLRNSTVPTSSIQGIRTFFIINIYAAEFEDYGHFVSWSHSLRKVAFSHHS